MKPLFCSLRLICIFLKLYLFIYLAMPGPTLKLQHENSQLQLVNPVLWPGMEPGMEPRPLHPLAGSLESQPLDHQGCLNMYFEGGTEKHPISHKVLISVWIHDFLFYSMGYVCAQLLSRVWISMAPWTVAYWAPLSMWFSRQEYWSGLPRDQTWISCISCISR